MYIESILLPFSIPMLDEMYKIKLKDIDEMDSGESKVLVKEVFNKSIKKSSVLNLGANLSRKFAVRIFENHPRDSLNESLRIDKQFIPSNEIILLICRTHFSFLPAKQFILYKHFLMSSFRAQETIY
ncbi:8940_t:CDS:2 [Funneliformis mosseae]|uniref:8940_t:CDS:1 n=1 Tax=Funneliformis mosseae TaxID=27381 RepID=A0A9N9EJ06_FUNMO|nr:8940_t:CDS:2 [Funneliformis mosseae]